MMEHDFFRFASTVSHTPEQEEDEYGEEETQGAADDPGDGAEVLLEVDQYHRILLRRAGGERS